MKKIQHELELAFIVQTINTCSAQEKIRSKENESAPSTAP